jgi:hypothetical protein
MYQQVQSPATSAPNNNSNIIPDSSGATTSVYYAMNV